MIAEPAPPAHRDRYEPAAAVIAVLLSLCSLWDFYLGEIRFFDFAALGLSGLILLSASLLGYAPAINSRRDEWLLAFAMLALFLSYSIVGIAINPDNAKPAFGILMGSVTLILVRQLPIQRTTAVSTVTWIAWLHLAAYIAQVTWYYARHQVLNFHAPLGLEPRLLSSIFRPAGLFLEPAIYCFFAASVFLLRRQLLQPVALIDYLLLISMVASVSLWGLAASIILFASVRPRAFILVAISVVATLFVTYEAMELHRNPAVQMLSSRLGDLASDPSARQRYLGLFNFFSGLLTDPAVLFGSGINNAFEERGTNGLSYIVNSVGISGLGLFIFLCLFQAPKKQWRWFLFSFFLLLTAASLWKGLYLWLWVALMIHPYDRPLPMMELTGRLHRP